MLVKYTKHLHCSQISANNAEHNPDLAQPAADSVPNIWKGTDICCIPFNSILGNMRFRKCRCSLLHSGAKISNRSGVTVDMSLAFNVDFPQ